MASLYKEALKNAQKQQDEFRKYVEKSAAKQSKKKTEPQPIPRNQSTSEIPARSKEKHKSSSGRHRIDADTRQTLNKEVKTNPIPQAITRFNEKVVNDIALAPVTIPYQIATGKKLIDFGLDPETESAKVGAGVGNFLGTAASYALGYKAAGKAISKGAEKLLASEAGKKATAKVVGSALGKKAGQEAAENVVGGIARNIVGDATVGTLLNLSDARGRGLEGEELAKDMALNAAIDFGVGNALEFLPMAAKAIKNVKTEPRIVNGKVKYVKVNNTANQTAGENLPFADSAARDIPFADSANVTSPDIMTPETQQKIFSAVEKRSGAKIVRADLPDGIDGTYENGVITISNSAKNPAYTVLKHELTHHIESSGNYQALSDFIEGNMREAGYDVEGAINQIRADYKRAGKELSPEQAKKEFIAKFSEEYLFNSEKSIERLARENPNVFRQIYDWIVDTVRKIGATDETKFLIDAQRKYEKALRTVGDARSENVQYAFSKSFPEEIKKALNGNMSENSQVKARDFTPAALVENGVDDLPMLITQKHIKTIIYSDKEAKLKGLPVNKKINYHGLGEDLLIKAIDGMDSPADIYKRGDKNYLVITEVKDKAGNNIIVPVQIDGKGTYNDVYIDENQILSVYGKRNLDDYLEKSGYKKIDIEKGTALNPGVQFPDISDSLSKSLPQNPKKVNAQKITIPDAISKYAEAINNGDNNILRRMVEQRANEAGYNNKLYHQTGATFTEFDTKKASAGKYDSELPTGIFMKPDSSDIGLKGKTQMELYSKIQNPLRFRDRADAVKFWEREIPGYKEANNRIKAIDNEYQAKYNDADSADDTTYAALHKKLTSGEITRDEFKAQLEEAVKNTQKVLDNWKKASNEARLEAKRLIDDYIASSRYDGMIVDNDAGSFGRSVKTYISFDPKNVKSADPITYNKNLEPISLSKRFDSNNPDIRYSLNSSTLGETDYTRRLKQTSQNLYGETGNKYLDIPKADETMPKQPAAEPKAEPEPVKAPRGSVKARGYERRRINQLKQNIKSSLGVNKYSDNAKMNTLIDEAVEKMKNGRLSDSEKNALFDTLFEEGIITDTTMLDRYADLKRDLRNTAIKVTDDIKANIPDFQNFRQGTFGKLRLNDAEGMAVDDLYAGLRMQYPELFPELNTTAEMVQRLAEVAGSIKQTETRLTHAFSTDIETLRAETKAGFDAAMDEMEKQVNIVSKYLSRPTVISSDEATAYAKNIKQIQRDINNLSSKILLDDEDWGTVDMLLKGRISPKTVRQININAENIITMYEAKAKLQAAEKGLADIKAKTRAEYARQAEDAIEGSELWQDRAGFRMSRETPERVMYDIAGKESGQKLIDSFIRPIHQNEAISTKMKKELRGTVKELNISTKPQYEVSPDLIEAPGLKEEHLKEIRKTRKINLSESALVQLYGEGLIDTDVLEIVGADVPKIQNAVTTMRQIYNQLIDAANQELIRHGYEPIEYRKDYFPHFTEERPDGVLANIADKLGIKILKDELPTDIAGLTHTFRPGKKWFGNALSRTGRYTEYDAIKGFDIYLEGIADVIHHTEDIQKLRTLENTLRLRYSDDGVRSEILKLDEQAARGEITDAVRDARAALIFDAGDTKLGSFATWLRNYTDSLAGKKTLLDRTFEHAIGRTLYNSSKAIENRVAANMVSLNPASWLTNLIPIVQAGEVKQMNLIKGMAQTINNKVRPDNFADASVFLTNRKGSDVLWKSGTEKWQDILSSPMKWIDEFTSETITRAKYLEEIDKGASPAEAMRAADDLAASIIADRSKGALPNVFNSKNPISKILTMYQVEVNNQWSHLLKDIPRTEGNVKRVAMAFTKYAIASYIFNDIYEYFIGRRPALDPISWVNDFVGDTTGKKVPNFMDALLKGEGFDIEQKTGGAAVAALGKNIAQDIPFVGGLLEGGRVPISSALPSASKLATTGGNLITGDVPTNKALYDIGNELAKPITYMTLPYGGGQIKKIAEGTETFIRKGNYAVNNDGEDELRYAVDPTAGNLVKGLAFGRYSMGNADEYIDSGFKRLSKNKTQAYKDAIEAGSSPQETENFLRSLKGKSAAEIRNAIMESDFTPAQKNAIGLPLEKNKTIDYSSQTSFQTSLLTPKQQEKVSDLKITGLSDEDALEAYNMYLDADGSDVAKSIEMLTKRSYQDMVFEVLGISDGSITKARKLTSAGITGKQYDTVKRLADANGSGNVSIEEAKAYLDSKSFTRKEKFALVKALTGCKDKNNPYR